jgi:hypothetical protein
MAEEGFVINDLDHMNTFACSVESYGIYDTRDDVWLGDNNGPRVFTREDSKKAKGLPHETLAKIAAQIAGVQLGYSIGRLQARVFNQGDLRLRDEVPTKMGPIEALIRLENGRD